MSYVLNQFPSIVLFDMKGFHISASGAIQGHHGPLVILHVCETRKFVMAILHWKQGLLCDNKFYQIPEKCTKLAKVSLNNISQDSFSKI